MYGYFTERDANDNFCTDLACERRGVDPEAEGVEYKREVSVGGNWERIKITSEPGADLIGRPIGIYNTLEVARMDLLDEEAINDAIGEIANELCYIFDISDIFPGRILVAGLGNSALTPDSIGSESAKRVKPTMHIKEFDKATGKTKAALNLPAMTQENVISALLLDLLRNARALISFDENLNPQLKLLPPTGKVVDQADHNSILSVLDANLPARTLQELIKTCADKLAQKSRP